MKCERKQVRNTCIITGGIVFLSCIASIVYSHCEIPCGIYDDPMRFDMMAENIKTIEKAMLQINQLEGDSGHNSNQIVRWIINKEHHADQLCEVVTQYFLKQRIKPVWDEQNAEYAKYTRQLVLLHKLMVYSMKCKQTTDLENVSRLRESLEQFKKTYLGKESSQHDHS